jgi:hypothetical protein
MGACAGSFIAHQAKRIQSATPAALIAIVLAMLVADHRALGEYVKRIGLPSSNAAVTRISEHVKAITQPGDLLWSPGTDTFLYAETGRLSPTKYIYAFPHVFMDTWKSTRREKLDRLKNDLLKNPPRVIVLPDSGTDLIEESGLAEWFSGNYVTYAFIESGRRFEIATFGKR